jgi:hypothetical protein
MLMGPDDDLCISVRGAFSPAGSGAVIRFEDVGKWRAGLAPRVFRQ